MQKSQVSGGSCSKNIAIHHNVDLVFSMAQNSSQGLKDIDVFAKVKSEWMIDEEYEKEFRAMMRMNLTLGNSEQVNQSCFATLLIAGESDHAANQFQRCRTQRKEESHKAREIPH
jgi:hypothetical protein